MAHNMFPTWLAGIREQINKGKKEHTPKFSSISFPPYFLPVSIYIFLHITSSILSIHTI